MKRTQKVSVSGFIRNIKNEILLVKRAGTDNFLPGLWEMPGGGVDFGEKPTEALQREIQEETGLTVTIGKPLFIDSYVMEEKDEKIQKIEISFECFVIDKKQDVSLSFEHSEYSWVAKDDVGKFELTDYMRNTVNGCFDGL